MLDIDETATTLESPRLFCDFILSTWHSLTRNWRVLWKFKFLVHPGGTQEAFTEWLMSLRHPRSSLEKLARELWHLLAKLSGSSYLESNHLATCSRTSLTRDQNESETKAVHVLPATRNALHRNHTFFIHFRELPETWTLRINLKEESKNSTGFRQARCINPLRFSTRVFLHKV
jgi:hypothetical protein